MRLERCRDCIINEVITILYVLLLESLVLVAWLGSALLSTLHLFYIFQSFQSFKICTSLIKNLHGGNI